MEEENNEGNVESLVLLDLIYLTKLSDQTAENDKRKLISKLKKLIVADMQDYYDNDIHDHDEILSENSRRAKETFKKILQMRPDNNGRDKRMPHKDQLDLLQATDPALCKTLRDGTVRDFYKILYPKQDGNLNGTIVPSEVTQKDLDGTIFCLEGTKTDLEIFKDLTKRAELLADEIHVKKQEKGTGNPNHENQKIKCYLMDGHGRLFLALIKALIDKEIDPDNDVEFTICEIDDDVHEYHKYVFPRSVKKEKRNVLEDYGAYVDDNSVVYLNFCSVTSSQDPISCKLNPRCIKENVLRFIWRITQPTKGCSVMVSLVIRDCVEGDEKLFPPAGENKKYITGLGFLKVIRDITLFNSKDSDILIRPDNSIPWSDEVKRMPNPEGIGNKRSQPFVSVMIHPKCDLTTWFKNNNISIDYVVEKDMVMIKAGDHKDQYGLVIKQSSPKTVRVALAGEDKEVGKMVSSCEKLNENEHTDKARTEIKSRLAKRRLPFNDKNL